MLFTKVKVQLDNQALFGALLLVSRIFDYFLHNSPTSQEEQEMLSLPITMLYYGAVMRCGV